MIEYLPLSDYVKIAEIVAGRYGKKTLNNIDCVGLAVTHSIKGYEKFYRIDSKNRMKYMYYYAKFGIKKYYFLRKREKENKYTITQSSISELESAITKYNPRKLDINELLSYCPIKYRPFVKDYYCNRVTLDFLAKEYDVCITTVRSRLQIGIDCIKQTLLEKGFEVSDFFRKEYDPLLEIGG